jgi:4-amino-4-deoxy-L-arabinose transferase-like glycosyltransferase
MPPTYQKSGPAAPAQPTAGEAFIPGLTPGVFSLESDNYPVGWLIASVWILEKMEHSTQLAAETRQQEAGSTRVKRKPDFLRDFFAIAVLSLMVVLCKAPLWKLPFHWDEAGAYISPSHWLAEGSLWWVFPGFHPLGRFYGHPPALYLALAVVYRLFGDAIPPLHAMMTGFSVLGIAYTYLLGKHLWGRQAGLMAAVLLFFMPTWFAQSGMVLADLPIAALGVMAAYYAVRRRFLPYLLSGICLVLLKETAGATIVAILIYKLFEWRAEMPENGSRARLLLMRWLGWALPLLLLGGFFLWQKLATGMFCDNPYFGDHPLFRFDNILRQGGRVFLWTFILRYRWVLLLLIALQGIFRRRSLFRRENGLFGLIALSFLLAFTLIFFLTRYMLPVYPFLCITAAGAALQLMRPVPRWLLAGLILAGFTTQYFGNSSGYYHYDDSLQYLDMIEVNRSAAAYIEENHPHARVLAVWPVSQILSETYQGYVDRPVQVVAAGRPFDLMVHFNAPGTGIVDLKALITPGEVKLEKRFECNGKWVEVYRKAAGERAWRP